MTGLLFESYPCEWGRLKIGTKVKNIACLAEGDHNIDCKVKGIGAIGLKSKFVEKS
ncbi:MAG: hypothetical protein D3924_05925 [Candidatus Electrothrix sp. AR4]|nr:hypothetical protein [Candidatus Electrothrix sp. AR4]